MVFTCVLLLVSQWITDVFVAYFQSTTPAEFTFTGPSNVMLAAASIFHVDMYLPAPLSDIRFEAFTPTNYTDIMTVCTIAVVSVGSNFDCVPYEKFTYNLYPSASGKTDEYGRLDIGRVFNAGMQQQLQFHVQFC